VSESLRVCVEFEPGADPIGGRLSWGNGDRPFTGWLGLIAALENAISGPWDRSNGGEDPLGAGDPQSRGSSVG
jgi:hypothetical protein